MLFFTGQQVEYDYDHSQDEEDDSEGRFLGLTAPQRFIIALFLLLIVCVVGAACLVLTGSVSLPVFIDPHVNQKGIAEF